MLTSTSCTKDPSQEQLANDHGQLVECGLVVGEPTILLEQRVAFGLEDVHVVLELARPGLRLAHVPLQFGDPRLRLLERRAQLRRLVGKGDQLATERETIQVRGEERLERFVAGIRRNVRGWRRDAEA